jgi:hypothetical protein
MEVYEFCEGKRILCHTTPPNRVGPFVPAEAKRQNSTMPTFLVGRLHVSGVV